MNSAIVAIDPALLAGVAWKYDDSSQLNVIEIEGTPLFQIHTIFSIVNNINNVLLEDFVYLSNKNSSKTILSLVKRLGYLQYTFESLDIKTTLLNLNSVRKPFNVGNKQKKKLVQTYINNLFNTKLSDNHTDALSMLIYTDLNKEYSLCEWNKIKE